MKVDSASSLGTGRQFSLQPAPAWTAIIALIIIAIVAPIGGAGKALNFIFPAISLLVGLFLYFRAPLLYTGFTWWLWFLSPLVRRLADFRGAGFTNPSPILLAPYLVTLVSAITLWKCLPKVRQMGGVPFVVSIAAIGYGFLIGLILKSTNTVIIGLLDWLTPVLFGFHLFAQWREYPTYRQNFERVFVWGTLIMGVYGVIQFLIAPEWDRFWLQSAEIVSAGIPAPLELRVWSTMSSPEPFAAVVTVGLLILFSSQGAIVLPTSIAGYLSFLLTQVRAAWIGWIMGVFILTNSLKPKFQMRLVLTILVMSLCIVPLATMEPFSTVIGERLSTLSDVENDNSAAIRQSAFREHIDAALTNVLGEGIGGSFYDNAIIGTLLNLGWLGTIPYIGGLVLMIHSLFQSKEGKSDPFIGVARSAVISSMIRFPVNGVILEASGMVLWGALGIGLAALKYYRSQSTAQTQSLNQSLITNQIHF